LETGEYDASDGEKMACRLVAAVFSSTKKKQTPQKKSEKMDLIVPVLVRRYQRLLKLKKNGGKHEE
jgi:hypothetical protein